MYTYEELTRIRYSVNSCLFKKRDVLVIFVKTKADILSPKSFFVVVLGTFGTEPSLSPFLYSRGLILFCFLVLILTLSRKYLAAILGICCKNKQIFIHWRSSDHRNILSWMKWFSRWCKTRPLAQLANSEIKHYHIFFWFVPKTKQKKSPDKASAEMYLPHHSPPVSFYVISSHT